MTQKLSRVDIIIAPGKFEDLRDALQGIGIGGMTVSKVLGSGMRRGHKEYYRGQVVYTNLLQKLKVEVVVSADDAENVIRAAKKALHTGEAGDGKIFVYDVANVIRISNGAEGVDALQYHK
jgi:nitrogen regulatory protein P-II 1